MTHKELEKEFLKFKIDVLQSFNQTTQHLKEIQKLILDSNKIIDNINDEITKQEQEGSDDWWKGLDSENDSKK